VGDTARETGAKIDTVHGVFTVFSRRGKRGMGILDGWTLLVVLTLALACKVLHMGLTMDASDWLDFWIGGPIRRAIFEVGKCFLRLLGSL